MWAVLVRLLALAVVLCVGAGAYVWQHTNEILHSPLTPLPAGETFTVERGMSFGRMVDALENRGVLSDGWALKVHARLKQQAVRVQAGEYAIVDGMTPLTMLDTMLRGDTVSYAVTLVEGKTFRQFLEALGQAEALETTLNELSDAEIMAKLGHNGEHPEGRFMPNTYSYAAGATDVQILKRAYDAMANYLGSAWEKRAADLPYKRPYDALIMASIIEKETGRADERAEIAGVFIRRLKIDMKLQTDPTVIYGMGERYDGNIRRKDLREDTPYNTYVHKGLTPTPIANPGTAAINAALHPAAGTALYFVAKGDGSGGHAFSDTYAQHQQAVRAYLKRLRERKRKG